MVSINIGVCVCVCVCVCVRVCMRVCMHLHFSLSLEGLQEKKDKLNKLVTCLSSLYDVCDLSAHQNLLLIQTCSNVIVVQLSVASRELIF